jgi:hypothetical protein
LQGGFPNKLSLVRGLLDKYASDITVSGKDIDAKPGTEAAKALAALTMKGA